MKQRIFLTNNSWSSLTMRFTISLVLFPHGIQKMFKLLGGYGFHETMKFLTTTIHLPWIIALSVIIIEFFGPIFLILGLCSRIWSALIIILMVGAVLTSHIDNGFFMNWFNNQKGEGYEYHLLMIGLSLAIFINGSGKYSIDNILQKL